MKKSILSLGLIAGFAIIATANAETTITKTTDPVTGTTTTTTMTRSNDTDPRVKTITSEKEFTTYAYNRWDTNGDGYIEPDEWNSDVVTWYGPGVTSYKTYADWDTNHNGKLDENEFDRVVNDTHLYKTWNVTSTTVPTMMTPEASFASYDLNGDGSITPSEWAKTHGQ